MTLYGKRFRVETARYPLWDYHDPGWYFVTICTRNRVPYFGSVIGRRMVLSPVGVIARNELLRTPEIRDNVDIDVWVIMPDHVHIIIRILPRDTSVETHCGASLPTGCPNRFGPQSNNLPAIVRGFKSAVKKQANSNGIYFEWQARYHDHIIRNEAELSRIRNYINQNVAKWKQRNR
jgi:REP element-mobilizing transposase RayT